ncbi:hypothetical protein [Actinoplanes sp. NPDC089786]|uniref:hypothetical protein n=1 Tax=Actinoplanes sp. NPDC089786 TaxID=3155185 RepID=UPI00342FCB25
MNFRLAVVLGLFGLVRPVLSVVGAFDGGVLGKPVGPIVVTVVICVVQVVAVVVARVGNPVLTLGVAGVAYGVFAILLNLSLQPVLASAEAIPLPGYVAIPVFNALLGLVLGVVALGVQRMMPRLGSKER